MAAQVRVVFNNLPAIAAELRSNAGKVVAETARAIADAGSAAAPRGATGVLSGSIKARQSGPFRWVVEATAPYSVYVEYGTKSHGGPQPYLVPSAHQKEPDFIDGMSNLIPGA